MENRWRLIGFHALISESTIVHTPTPTVYQTMMPPNTRFDNTSTGAYVGAFGAKRTQ